MPEDTDANANADAGADTHTDRDRDGRRPGDHPSGAPGFKRALLDVARAAVVDACEAAETPWVSTRQVARQFPTGSRFGPGNERETAMLLRATADRGLLRRRMDMAVGADHPPTERWRVR